MIILVIWGIISAFFFISLCIEAIDLRVNASEPKGFANCFLMLLAMIFFSVFFPFLIWDYFYTKAQEKKAAKAMAVHIPTVWVGEDNGENNY